MRTVHIPVRSLLYGFVVVALAITGLAFLSEAWANGGHPVYLASINTGSKDVPSQPSIVVTGTGRATAPAEQAIVQILIVRDAKFAEDATAAAAAALGAGEPNSIAPVVDAITGAGVDRSAIRVVISPSLISVCTDNSPCTSVRVDVTVNRPDLKQLNAIIDAAGAAASDRGMVVQDVGAGYSVADCRSLQATARQAAIADARVRAASQAKSLGVGLGTLMQSSEGPPTAPADAGGCALLHGSVEDSWWTPGSVGLTVPAFDPLAAPEAAVDVQVTLAYAIQGNAAPS